MHQTASWSKDEKKAVPLMKKEGGREIKLCCVWPLRFEGGFQAQNSVAQHDLCIQAKGLFDQKLFKGGRIFKKMFRNCNF